MTALSNNTLIRRHPVEGGARPENKTPFISSWKIGKRNLDGKVRTVGQREQSVNWKGICGACISHFSEFHSTTLHFFFISNLPLFPKTVDCQCRQVSLGPIRIEQMLPLVLFEPLTGPMACHCFGQCLSPGPTCTWAGIQSNTPLWSPLVRS